MLAVNIRNKEVVDIISVVPSEKGYRVNVREFDDFLYVRNPPTTFKLLKARKTEIDLKILKTLRDNGWLTAKEISEIAGIKYNTVKKALTKLILFGLVVGRVDEKGRPVYNVPSGDSREGLLEKDRTSALRSV